MRFDSRHCRPSRYSKDRDQVVPWGPPRALRSYDGVGLAERGPRRAEGPLSGWNKFGPESYIDSDSLVSGRDSDESNADRADDVDCTFLRERYCAYAGG